MFQSRVTSGNMCYIASVHVYTLVMFNSRVFKHMLHSESRHFLSGVPQGAVLVPMLFRIYINEISRNITSYTKLFADNMKVHRVLRDTKEDVEELQRDLTRLESWSNDWQFKFNTGKCEVMRISKKTDNSSP